MNHININNMNKQKPHTLLDASAYWCHIGQGHIHQYGIGQIELGREIGRVRVKNRVSVKPTRRRYSDALTSVAQQNYV